MRTLPSERHRSAAPPTHRAPLRSPTLSRPPAAAALSTRLAALAAGGLLLAGCDGGPSLQDVRPPPRDPTPVVLIPGVEASYLIGAESGEQVWSGDPRLLVDDSSFERLALPVAPPSEPTARPAAGHTGVAARIAPAGPGPATGPAPVPPPSPVPPDRAPGDELPTDEPLVPGPIIRRVLLTDYYESLIEDLERERGPCVLPEDLVPESRCILLSWDWRRGVPEAARRLDRTIERLRRLRGDPGLQVDLVGHSAGGLVARWFVRFGGQDVLGQDPEDVQVDFAGAKRVRRAILIGVPNDGAPVAVHVLARGHRLGLSYMAPELLATMPGVFQALPRPGRVWAVDTRGRPLGDDLYDPATWQALGLSVFHPEVAERVRHGPGGERRLAALQAGFARYLERARRFALALAKPVPRPFSYSVFGGDCRATPSQYVAERVPPAGEDAGGGGDTGAAAGAAPGLQLRFAPEEIAQPVPGVDYTALMYAPGDGWVTRASALGLATAGSAFRVGNAVFACERHAVLAADPGLRHNLVGQLRWGDPGPRYALTDPSPAECRLGDCGPTDRRLP